MSGIAVVWLAGLALAAAVLSTAELQHTLVGYLGS